jgi:hypothetical protein
MNNMTVLVTLVFLATILQVANSQDLASKFQLKEGLQFSFIKPDNFNGEKVRYFVELKSRQNATTSFKMSYRAKDFDKIDTDYLCMINVSEEALDSATAIIDMYNAASIDPNNHLTGDPRNDFSNECPEFILSSILFSNLASGKPVAIENPFVPAASGVVYNKIREEKIKLKVDGIDTDLQCIVAETEIKTGVFPRKITMWVLNNPTCPLLIKRMVTFKTDQKTDFELAAIGKESR